MRKSCILSIFLTLALGSVFGQTSLGEKTLFWEQGASWTGGTMPGSVSGGTISGFAQTVVIDGTIKTHNNLTLTTSSLTINSGDTLVVFGNLTLSTASSLVNNGVLMVTGNVTNGASSVNNSATGKMVVMGNYSNALGLANTITGPAYLYGSETGFLFSPPPMSTQAQMGSNDPALSSYVNWMYGVLPIDLLSFTGKFAHGRVTLNWSTSGETNNDHFTIERSNDSTNFELISTVPGAVSSKELRNYSITDNEPLPGVSYYRLGQVDVDGVSTFQGVVAIENTTKISMTIYPNPATEYLFITGVEKNDRVAIKDVAGVHGLSSYPVTEIAPGKTGVNVSDLDTGVYCIHVTNASNNTSGSFRFVKR